MTKGQLVEGKFDSDLIPKSMEYAVLLPEGYGEMKGNLPLLYLLHGGGGEGPRMLSMTQQLFEQVWTDGRLPTLVVVAPSVTRSFYMDFRDGTQKWEQLLIGSFLSHMRKNYHTGQGREGLIACGISMGGMGALRLGFKYPELFTGIAALEPGIEPALSFKDIQFEDRFWRSDRLFEAIFGKPVDEEYWTRNNPASIAVRDAERIRASKLGIYLECGDEDSFGLHRGTEFLHRILSDNGILHEYHLVRGADHLGQTLGYRIQEALEFLGKLINPPPPDPVVENLRRIIVQQKAQAREKLDTS